jgi:hypothetical protein
MHITWIADKCISAGEVRFASESSLNAASCAVKPLSREPSDARMAVPHARHGYGTAFKMVVSGAASVLDRLGVQHAKKPPARLPISYTLGCGVPRIVDG